MALTSFEAVAYDLRINTENGMGIVAVTFEVYEWIAEFAYAPNLQPIYQKIEREVLYCAFGGNNNCNTLDQAEDINAANLISNRPYIICARAEGLSGDVSDTICHSFILQLPPVVTPTPSITLTVEAVTPTMDFTTLTPSATTFVPSPTSDIKTDTPTPSSTPVPSETLSPTEVITTEIITEEVTETP